MRIVAGILLILTGVINAVAGAGYAFVGGVTAAVGAAGEKERESTAPAANDPGEIKLAMTKEQSDSAKAAGGLIAALGFALLALTVLQISGAVVAFMRRAPMFLLAVGALSILGELAAPAVGAGFGILNVVGIATGLCAIVAALAIRSSRSGLAAV
jgi:hypothetical protein